MAVPYHQPVAPEIPDAQKNKAAGIIANFDLGASFLKGLGAFAQITAQRQNTELEMQQLAQNTAIKQQEFGLRKQELDQKYQFEKDITPLRIDLLEAQAENQRAHATAAGSASMNVMDYTRRVNEEQAAFNNRIRQHDLLNPNLKDPVSAWDKLQELKVEFGGADIPEIKNGIKMLEKKFEETSVPLPFGDKTERFTPGQIMEHLYDPNRHDQMQESLAKANYITAEKPYTDNAGTVVHNFSKTPTFKLWLDQGSKVDFSNRATMRPPISTMSRWEAAAQPSYNADGSAPLPEAENHAAVLDRARRAISAGRSRKAVMDTLQAQGIDPTEL